MKSSEPTTKVRAFFERYVLERDDLVLTIKSKAGASINVDGPFRLETFAWPDLSDVVVQPAFATPRPGSKETNVHMHVPWDDDARLHVRLWYEGTPYIPHTLRICFFRAPAAPHDPPLPSPSERGDELFWFYAYRDGPHRHPLCEILPPIHAKYSALRRVADIAP